MRIVGINIINHSIKYQPIHRRNILLSKDSFELTTPKDTVSFGKKKSTPQNDKKTLYKQFRKAECGDKDTSSVINNDKKYNALLSLIAESENYTRKPSPKEMLAIVSNGFDSEQTQRFIDLTDNKFNVSRKLSQKEASAFVKNNLDSSHIQRFIDLRDTDEDGNSLLSRPLTYSEACFVCQNDFDNDQAETFIQINKLYFLFDRNKFLNNKQTVSRFLMMTQGNKNHASVLSESLSPEEAVKTIINKFDDKQTQQVIDLTRNRNGIHTRPLSYDEAEIVIKNHFDDNQIQSFIDTKNYLQNKRNNQLPESKIKLSDNSIVLTVKENFDRTKTDILDELAECFDEPFALGIITDKKQYDRIISLTHKDKHLLSVPLTVQEAGFVVKGNLSYLQAEIYKKLVDCKINNSEALIFANNGRNVKRFTDLTNPQTKELTRPLKPDEAFSAITNKYDNTQMQELINLREKNPDLKLSYIDLLIKFIDYKDKTNISELNLNDKRNLLKLIVQINARLFNENVSKETYPLVPKNQKAYCDILSQLTESMGIDTKPLSDEDKKIFNEGIQLISQFFQTDNKNSNIQFDFPLEDFIKGTEESINKILKGLPELRTTLSKDTLNTLKNSILNPKFTSLSEKDRQCLIISVLLHNISGLNAQESAFDAFYIIQKLNLPEEDQLKIYELIKTQNWYEELNNAIEPETIAQNIAFETRHSNTFELSKILCEALQGKDCREKVNESAKKIETYLQKLQETQIFLPQTKIPKASKMKNCEIYSADGITNTVFYINQAEEDLSLYGFEEGTTQENWQGLVHGLDTEQQLQTLTTFSLIDSEALLSTSYMNPKEYKVFRQQGLILDVNPNDIHAGYYRDFGSGVMKDIEKLKRKYLFFKKEKNPYYEADRSIFRTYISQLIKNKLNCSTEDYLSYIRKITGCKSITDVEKTDKEFATALLEVFKEMDFGKRQHNRKYNEILISRPKIQGVFSYNQKYKDIPLFLRKYAQDNDLPIIMFG